MPKNILLALIPKPMNKTAFIPTRTYYSAGRQTHKQVSTFKVLFLSFILGALEHRGEKVNWGQRWGG